MVVRPINLFGSLLSDLSNCKCLDGVIQRTCSHCYVSLLQKLVALKIPHMPIIKVMFFYRNPGQSYPAQSPFPPIVTIQAAQSIYLLLGLPFPEIIYYSEAPPIVTIQAGLDQPIYNI